MTAIVIVGVVAVVAVSVLARRLGVAAPIALVLVGVGVGFVPGAPEVQIDPELVLAGVLPPLLYSAAIDMPATDFRRNLRTINGLAVVLVALSTALSACLVHALLPEAGWPAAFAVGAVISPTDAVAASSVGRRLGLPPRLLTVLEGEGLVNDASALTFLRSAVAATAGSVSIAHVAGDFLRAVLISLVVGLVVGHLNVRIRHWLPDAVSSTAVAFVVPFLAFLPAEHLEGSGVLAVVVAGIVTGHLRFRYLSASQRVTEETNWRTIAFLLEGGIFFMMGFGLEAILDDVRRHDLGLGAAVYTGLAVALLVMVLRLVFIAPLVWRLRRSERRAVRIRPKVQERMAAISDAEVPDDATRRKFERFTERGSRMLADLDFQLRESIDWRGGVVLGWSGMRGAITVAAAQTLPHDMPLRSQLILVAYVVAIVTLVVQGTTLPAVIRAVKFPQTDQEEEQEHARALRGELMDAAMNALAQVEQGSDAGAAAAAGTMRREFERYTGREGEGPSREDIDGMVQVRVKMLAAQRHRLDELRSLGAYDSAELEDAQQMIDIEEVRWQEAGS